MKTLNYISSQAPNRTILYARWNSMRNRCYNKNNPAYKHYGGRGIKVCDEWNKCPYGFVASMHGLCKMALNIHFLLKEMMLMVITSLVIVDGFLLLSKH